MKRAELLNEAGDCLVPDVEIADCTTERMVDLLGRESLGEGSAMFLAPCSSVHTLTMQFSIDLVFVDKSLNVVRLVWDVQPQRMSWGGPKAWGVVEIGAGWFPRDALAVGDRISLRELGQASAS